MTRKTNSNVVAISKADVAAWEHEYSLTGYTNVFNISLDEYFLKKIIKKIPQTDRRILILGCGSEINLQRKILLSHAKIEQIVCTDGSQTAIKLAQSNFSNEKICYVNIAHHEISNFITDIDSIVCNSILSASDQYNREVIGHCYKVLKNSGRLIGVFPSIFSPLEQAYHNKKFSNWISDGTIDLVNSLFKEPKGDFVQSFYPPSLLKKIFESNRFKLNSLEIIFFDSYKMMQHSEYIYGIDSNNGLPVWEYLVEASKYSLQAPVKK